MRDATDVFVRTPDMQYFSISISTCSIILLYALTFTGTLSYMRVGIVIMMFLWTTHSLRGCVFSGELNFTVSHWRLWRFSGCDVCVPDSESFLVQVCNSQSLSAVLLHIDSQRLSLDCVLPLVIEPDSLLCLNHPACLAISHPLRNESI